MVLKTKFLCAALLLLLQSCDCTDVDEFGQRVIVEVPIQSSPAQANFTVGDTIWWEADFSNQVRVEGVDRRLDLRNFRFFADFSLQHIPHSAVLVDSAIDIIAETGSLTLYSADEFLFYGIKMVATDARYRLKFGTVLRKPGVYVAGISTIVPFDEVDHPALYACNDTRREDFRIHYLNSSTDRQTYDTLLIPRLVNPEFIASATFEKYANVGSITYIVNE